MSIKYYHLAKDEELPDEFCAIRDVGGEPSEYVFYVPESEVAKLRELCEDMWEGYYDPRCEECHLKDTPTCADCPICAREASVIDRMRELGVEVVMDERRRS